MATRRLRYIPAIDGLRAVAVAAVIAFHLAPDAVPGGFLGVDTFFVVSGYLITSLLLAERRADGRIRFTAFWARRARRLLPALLFVLCAVAIAVAFWWPAEDLARIRGDALGGLGYVANWRFIASGDSYFDLATGPSPLRHLWSLAIEEQFYVVWPLVCAACLRRSSRLLGTVCVVGTIASVAAMIAAGPGDRAYYGTDTRASALMIGALVAVGLYRGWLRRPTPWLAPAGTAGLLLCGAAWWATGEEADWLFVWGFPLYALLTAITVAAVVRAELSPLSRLLSTTPLVAVGKVSYGLYLWHWPAIVLFTPARTGLDGVALGAFRLGATVAGTLLSYALIERPVRFGAAIRGRIAAFATGTAFSGTAVVVVLATAGAAPVPEYLRTPGSDGEIVAAVSVNEPVHTSVTTTPPPAGPRRPTSIVLVGDSVAWTFRDELGFALGVHGIPYASAAIVGCGAAVGLTPGLGVAADDDGSPVPWSDSCRDTTTTVQEQALAAVEPDLVLFHSTWETSDRNVDGQWVRYGTPAWDEQLRRELRAAVDRLSAGGARVAMLTAAPPVDGQLEQAIERDRERLARYNLLLRELAAEDDRVLLVDFAELVCDRASSGCPTEVDGITLRPLDGRHFEHEGATWVAGHLTDELLALDLDAA